MNPALEFTTDDVDAARPRVGMAPLVDIVLLLICFYLLVMRSIQSHTDDSIVLPEVVNEHVAEVLPAELVINLDASGVVALNGAIVDDETLRAMLNIERGRAVETRRRLHVVVRADARQAYEALDAVLAACRDAGVGAITLRTRSRSMQGSEP